MKLHIDRDACQGHNRCYAAYPDLFDLDDEAKAVVRVDVVPNGREDDARSAVFNCPERAISISE